jgi:hypothetical protein
MDYKLNNYYSYNYKTFTNNKFINNNTYIKRKRGGVIPGLNDALEVIFKPIIAPIVAISQVFVIIIQTILWFVQLIIWVIRLIIFLFISLFSIIGGGFDNLIKYLAYTAIMTPFEILSYLYKLITGNNGEQDEDEKTETNKCYGVKADGTVPTLVLVSTILCPPLGIFMVYGMLSWLYILICAVLCLIPVIPYFPGLIFALIKIYIDINLY